MTQMDQAALAYLARRDVSVQWRGFLRGLLETLDAHLDHAGRDGLLRAVGTRMAASLPLAPSATLPELEARMNDTLSGMGWGFVAVALDEADRSLRLTHHAAPAVATAQDASGLWLGTVLEGLYDAWLTAQQGGTGSGAQLRVVQSDTGRFVLRYGA